MKRTFLFFLFSIFSCHALAELSLYGSLGSGVMLVQGIGAPTHLERQIFQIPGVTGTSVVENKSPYKTVSLGVCPHENFCLEGAYLWGAQFSKTITASGSAYVGVINVNGIPVDFGTLGADVVLRQEAYVSATQLSLLGKTNIYGPLDAFVRVGGYDYQIKLVSKLPLKGGICLYEESTQTGNVPMASIGFDLGVPRLKLRLEGLKTGRVRIYSLSFSYSF